MSSSDVLMPEMDPPSGTQPGQSTKPKPVFVYSGAARGRRYEAWREEFCRSFCRLDVAPVIPEGIRCSMELSQVGPLSLGRTEGSGSFLRTRSLLSDGSNDLVLLTAVKGDVLVVQRGLRVELRPSEMCLLTLDDVGESRLSEGGRYTALRMQRRDLVAAFKNIEDKLTRPLEGADALRRLVTGYFALCFEMGPALDGAGQNAMAQHMTELVAHMAKTSGDVPAEIAGGDYGAARFQLIQAQVLDNLPDCGLSVAAVARHARMSPRQLQRLFEQAGSTFSEFVLEHRLKLACRLLTSGDGRWQKISSVAYDAGFGDLSYFNRCFHRRFGRTPSEWRHERVRSSF